MLVLTRKDGESIKIAENIEIKVIQSFNKCVKIGITAPKDVLVLRSELANEIAQANEKASHVDEKMLSELSKKIK